MKNKWLASFAVFMAIFAFVCEFAGCKSSTDPSLKTYKITYVSEHGEVPAEKSVKEGYKLTSEDLPDLSDINWNFIGWDKSVGYVVNSNTTITASWEKIIPKYKITYISAYGVVPEIKTVDEGYILTLDDLPELEDLSDEYEFVCWSIQEGFTVNEDIEITAIWRKLPQKCRITYISEFGNPPEEKIVNEGYELTKDDLPELFENDNKYVFIGWNRAEGFIVTEDVEITANWKAIEDTSCSIIYNSPYGVVPEIKIVDKGYVLTEEDLPMLTEEGWSFIGWNVAAGTVIDTSVFKITASWEKIKCRITYVSKYGEVPADHEVDYGYELTKDDLPVLSEEEHIFKGWNKNIGFIVTENVIIVANWEDVIKVKYTIVYSSEYGTVPDSKIVEDGYILTESDLPVLKAAGFSFTGWDKKAGDVITGNTTITASWIKKNTYTLTFVTERGITPEPLIVEEGHIITFDDLPKIKMSETDDYFQYPRGGWDIKIGTVVTKDIIVTASWENNIVITFKYLYDGIENEEYRQTMHYIYGEYLTPQRVPVRYDSSSNIEYVGSDIKEAVIITESTTVNVYYKTIEYDPDNITIIFDSNYEGGESKTIKIPVSEINFDDRVTFDSKLFKRDGYVDVILWEMILDGNYKIIDPNEYHVYYSRIMESSNHIARFKAIWYTPDQVSTITWNKNDGSVNPETFVTYTPKPIQNEPYYISLMPIDYFVREGYVLYDFTTNPDGTPDYEWGRNTGYDKTLYAIWEKEVRIIYNSNSGDGISEEITKIYAENHGSTADRYTFYSEDKELVGWALTPDATEPEYGFYEQIELESGTTLYAVWKDAVFIIFNANDGSDNPLTKKQKVSTSSSYCFLNSNTFTNNGIDFLGWATEPNKKSVDYKDGSYMSTPKETIVLYAVWDIPVHIIYNANDGTANPEIKKQEVDTKGYSYNHTLEENTFVNGDMIFVGWATTPDAQNRKYCDGESITKPDSDLILYAIWDKPVHIIYNANDGSETPETIVETYSSKLKTYGYYIENSFINTMNSSYEFVGWKTDSSENINNPGTMYNIPTTDIVFYAVWKDPLNYTFVYHSNYSGSAEEKVESKVSITPEGSGYETIACPFEGPEGYYFNGWTTYESGTMSYLNSEGKLPSSYISSYLITKDNKVNIYAVWTKIPVVTYCANDGSIEPEKITEVVNMNEASYILKENPFTNGSKKFLGWATSSTEKYNSYIKSSGTEITRPNYSTTYYAIWVDEESYTFIYHSKISNVDDYIYKVSNEEVADGYTLKPNPFKNDGFRFTGWALYSVSSDYSFDDEQKITKTQVDNNGGVIKTIELYACWLNLSDGITVTYKSNFEGSGYDDVVQTITDIPETGNIPVSLMPCSFVREGYCFGGWGVNSTSVYVSYEDGQTIVNYRKPTLTLYALWKPYEDCLQVTYDANDGSDNSEQITQYVYNKSGYFTLRKNTFTREYYEFLGWATTSTATVPSYYDETKTYFSSNKILYAVWKDVNNFKITYQNLNGATNPNPQTYRASEGFELQNITRPGYVFEGWYLIEDGVVAVEPFESCGKNEKTGNLIFTAKWSPATNTKYTVKHYLKPVSGYTYELDYTEELEGTTGQITQAVARDYEHFTPATFSQAVINADGSTVITIYYNRIKETMMFDTGKGTAVNSITGIYGSTYTKPSNPTRTNYEFMGWTPELPSTLVGGTYTAIWKASGNTPYVVKHYKQNIEGEYLLSDIENLQGTVEEETEAIAKNYSHYICKGITQQIINEDGSTVISIYYDLELITLRFNLNNGSDPIVLTGRYGAPVNSIEDPVKENYVFAGWDKVIPETYTEDKIFTAQWKVTSTIDVTFGTESDIHVTSNIEDGKVTITADTGYTSYSWKFDGVRQTPTTNVLEIDTSELKKGYYEVFVTARKNGSVYSSQIYIEVK